jgi:hypothetical protein
MNMLWQKGNTQFLSLSLVYLSSMESAKDNFLKMMNKQKKRTSGQGREEKGKSLRGCVCVCLHARVRLS